MLAASFLMVSCGTDEDPILEPVNLGPTEFTITQDTVTVLAGEGAAFDYYVETNADSLVAMVVTTDFDLTTQDTVWLGAQIEVGTYTWFAPDTASSGDSYSLQFAAYDTDGNANALLEAATVVITGTPLGAQINGELWHIAGSQLGSWDLVGDVARMQSDNDGNKSMVNTDAGGDAFTGSWTSVSTDFTNYDGSLFALFNVLDYGLTSTAMLNSKEQLMDIYSQETSSPNVMNPSQGNTYVVLLPDGDTYVLLEINSNDPLAGTGNNTGGMTFAYKKSL